MKKTLCAGLFLLAGFAHAGITSHWVTAFQQGSLVYNVEAKNGVLMSFNCDYNHSEVPDRELFIDMPGKPGWIDSTSNKLELKIGEDTYPIGLLGSNAGDSWWFGFWRDAVDTDQKNVTLSIDGADVATFTLKGAKKLYESSDASGCIRNS